MTTKTILLIHSESSIRELVQVCLRYLGGWRVLVATSPLEGLQRAVQEQPDAIVLDLSSSSKDYLNFLQNLRAKAVSQNIPVIVLTAGAKWLGSEQLKRFQVVGVIDYMSDPNQLSNQIATLLDWDTSSPPMEDED